MGAAWIIENEHAAIFTPNFDLSSKEFQSGALDPREIGFYINDEERILSFIQLLSENFELTNNPIIISQNVKKFIEDINKIKPNAPQFIPVKKAVEPIIKITESITKKVSNKGNDLYTKFLNLIDNDKLKDDELVLLQYIVDTSRVKLMTGWQEENEVQNIQEWEKINDINDKLSTSYTSVLRRFELRGFTEISNVTSSGNSKEVKLKDEIALNILDLPSVVMSKVDTVVKKNFFEHIEEVQEDDKLPF
jgi:hypothetical protein